MIRFRIRLFDPETNESDSNSKIEARNIYVNIFYKTDLNYDELKKKETHTARGDKSANCFCFLKRYVTEVN